MTVSRELRHLLAENVDRPCRQDPRRQGRCASIVEASATKP
jgi:hypothetical protein